MTKKTKNNKESFIITTKFVIAYNGIKTLTIINRRSYEVINKIELNNSLP
jgi:hypothetical protein